MSIGCNANAWCPLNIKPQWIKWYHAVDQVLIVWYCRQNNYIYTRNVSYVELFNHQNDKKKIFLCKLSTKLIRREILPNLQAKVKVKIYISDLNHGVIDRVYNFAQNIVKIKEELNNFNKYI